MIRTLGLVIGLGMAGAASQAPEFTQQYQQRLAGQVDALTEVVHDFDRSALDAGLGREAALSQMTGTDFLLARQQDMRRTFARHARLVDDLAALRAASPLQRLVMPQRLFDRQTLAATWSDFAPAVPLTTAGFVAAMTGFVAGWAGLALLSSIFRRPRRAAQTRLVRRREPVLFAQQSATPQLKGERR